MDLLPLPAGQGRLVQTPFAGFKLAKWDGGQFIHFPCRNNRLGCVSRHLQRCSCAEAAATAREPLALGLEEKEAIIQHWLFIGLLAEFHGLNDVPHHDSTQKPGLPTAERARGISNLYHTFTKDDKITCASLFEEAGGKQMVEHLLLNRDAEDLTERFRYLHDCLGFVSGMLHALSTDDVSSEGGAFNRSISLSIAGLVELLGSSLSVLNNSRPDIQYTASGSGILAAKYLDPGGDAYNAMVEARWCRSDIERIRHVFFGISTRYFLSHLARPETSYTHGEATCSFARCGAAQIDPDTYQPSHAGTCKRCDLAGLDEAEVKRILMRTPTFPILRLVLHDYGGVDIHVEEHVGTGAATKRRPFVALSHVWADGLGNPTANAVQSCQMRHLADLLVKLPAPAGGDDAEKPLDSGELAYWFWIDTLCCPVHKNAPAENKAAMSRIREVYEEADHVLVLDKSLSPFTSSAAGEEAGEEALAKSAETCLRILTSTWMRRLWTLQEGVLAKSLCFQFQDRLVNLVDESAAFGALLFKHKDLRYFRIWRDVSLEISRLSNLQKSELEARKSLDATKSGDIHQLFLLWKAQAALYFRAVSVANDEPLCIATLLSLGQQAVSAHPCRQMRMKIIWEQIAAKCGGIPARILFYVEEPLTLDTLSGWRWAPKSLLRPELESGMDYNTAITRLTSSTPSQPLESWDCKLGIWVENKGLKVSYPGMRIKLTPWTSGESKWPWSLYCRQLAENQLFCRESASNKWFTISNYFRSVMTTEWTRKEWSERDKRLLGEDNLSGRYTEGSRKSQPIFNELAGPGELVLIKDTDSAAPTMVHLLARVQDEDATRKQGDPLHVHAYLPVFLTEVSEAYWPVLDTLQRLAQDISYSKEHSEVLRLWKKDNAGCVTAPSSDECRPALAALQQKMQSVTSAHWVADGEHDNFISGYEALFGKSSAEDCWKALTWAVPYDLSVESIARGQDQMWTVDRPVGGDGKCKERCCVQRP